MTARRRRVGGGGVALQGCAALEGLSVGDGREPGVRLVVSLYREFEQVARRGDLSMAQYRAMLYLLAGARRAGELAAASEVTRPTVSAMIAGLRDQGWVAESVDPSDGRASHLVLTPAGRERLAAFERELADRLEELLPGLEREELRATFAAWYGAHATTRADRLGHLFPTVGPGA